MVKRILLVLDDETFEKLKKLKGERSWEEFLVKSALASASSSSPPKTDERSSVSQEKPDDTSDLSTATSNQSKETGDEKKDSPNMFCKPKEKIYDLKLYIDSLRKRGAKIKDHWEEEDKYCFEIE